MGKQTCRSMCKVHLNPEKEQELKLVKIDVESQVQRIVNLTKNINHGNKERNLRKKSEAISLVEDLQKRYESLHALYDDLREQVKKSIDEENNSSSTSYSDSESYYSVGGSTTPRTPQQRSTNNEHDPALELADTVLKDKLTFSIQVNQDSNPGTGDVLKDLESLKLQISGLREEKDLLKDEVESLTLEISRISMEKNELREQMARESDEAMRMKDEAERLKLQISGEKERLKEQVECKANEMMQMKEQIMILEALLSEAESKENEHVKSLTELNNLLSNANAQKSELISELEKKSKEVSQGLVQRKNLEKEMSLNEQKLSQEKEGLQANMHDLESKFHSMLTTKTELENQVKKLTHEGSQSLATISKLQDSLSEKENELSTERMKLTNLRNITSAKIKSLEAETRNLKSDLESIESEKTHLQAKADSLQTNTRCIETELGRERAENSRIQSQVEKLSKSNFQVVERKVDEMLEEFRKQLEDKYRILTRRIRVAEQLHVENKEWYHKTKEAYEQQNKDLKSRAERNEIELKNIKDMTLTANEVLTSLESVALTFEESSVNFLNRISKASCELQFAKHWAMRKNKAILHVGDEMDCVLAQLGDKEKEILVFREKVWKSENKARELEKTMKENEEAMLGLKEEKREAIRQLCVWIDYHRGRSDYYMKILSEMKPACKRAP